ncbi:uncharacterized protein PRCAT00005248001 [Priceomyces carsonii]|uniref:uncharacterized protein n=1 Tax=Priceomyces carsonii TaxID=28549 RepID=UPI002EDB377C|nr:unnamed protein product [Priceomyces carsonii]
MLSRSFGLEKLKNKVSGRRSSESSLIDLASFKSHEKRDGSHTINAITEVLKGHKDHREGNHLSPSQLSRLRAQSLSVYGHNHQSRSRSRSVNKKQAKELIKQETNLVILKKLLHVLQDLGLQVPIPLDTSNGTYTSQKSRNTKVYVSNTNDCIYLPPASSASFTYEDVENGGIPNSNESAEDESDEESAILSDDEESAISLRPSTLNLPNFSCEEPVSRYLRKQLKSFNSPNYLCTKIDEHTPIPHLFAVIVELKKEMVTKDLKIEFQSLTNILWPSGDPYNKNFLKEKFRIGKMEWQTSFNDCDYYINLSNSNDIKTSNVTPEKLAQRTRNYRLVGLCDIVDDTTDSFSIHSESSRRSSFNSERQSHTALNNPETQKPGFYVFLLPVILPEHIPATINSVNGSLNHILKVSFNKISDKIIRKTKVHASYNLPMARTPPSFANSIADKPIYVNRIWNDSLHYVITFPKKYVSLGSEHLINVKLVPLVKDVVIKRIKFNVLERITYVSKDLSKEYDYDGNDPFHLHSLSLDSKPRERIIPICELKTKHKSNAASGQTEPYKEQVIKCPDNNLLFSCYEPELDNFKLDSSHYNKSYNDTKIATPLDINVALPFLTTKADKQGTHISEDDPIFSSASGSRKASISSNRNNSVGDASHSAFPPSSPIIGALETHLTHSHYDHNNANLVESEEIIPLSPSSFMAEETHNAKECIQDGYTSVHKALYPDSNYRHIQIHHRLQVCFRISKPDPKDNNKMHHYEVVVDTPLVLLSSKCNEASIQLPSYDQIDAPFNPEPESSQREHSGFLSNGVSISTFNDMEGDHLPSFEEATSLPSSPITRSISLGEFPLSRLPSISLPADPAPAYDASPNKYEEMMNPLNIDELVNYQTVNGNSARPSKIKFSLFNAFAPPSRSNEDGFDDADRDAENDNESAKLQQGSTDNLSTTPTSLSNGVGSSISIGEQSTDESALYLNTAGGNIPKSSSTGLTVPDVASLQGDEESLHEEDPLNKKSISSSAQKQGVEQQADEQNSIYTQDTAYFFDQKSPLLNNNYSNDNLCKTKSNLINPSNYSLNDVSKEDLLTSTESNSNELQNIHHAYKLPM